MIPKVPEDTDPDDLPKFDPVRRCLVVSKSEGIDFGHGAIDVTLTVFWDHRRPTIAQMTELGRQQARALRDLADILDETLPAPEEDVS